jgi:hypothetical protein
MMSAVSARKTKRLFSSPDAPMTEVDTIAMVAHGPEANGYSSLPVLLRLEV